MKLKKFTGRGFLLVWLLACMSFTIYWWVTGELYGRWDLIALPVFAAILGVVIYLAMTRWTKR